MQNLFSSRILTQQSLCFTELCSLPHFYFLLNYELFCKLSKVQKNDANSHHRTEEMLTFLPYSLQIFSFTERSCCKYFSKMGVYYFHEWFCATVFKFYISAAIFCVSFAICCLCLTLSFKTYVCIFRVSTFILASINIKLSIV